MRDDVGGRGAPSRRPRDPPASSSSRRRPAHEREEAVHHLPPRNGPSGRAQYLLDSAGNGHVAAIPQHYSHQHYSQPLPAAHKTSYNGGGRDRPTLRRRGSSNDWRRNGASHYKQSPHYDGTIADLPPRRVPHSPTTTVPTARLSRILSLTSVCILMFWASFLGIGTSISLARGTLNFVFGRGRQNELSEDDMKESQLSLEIESATDDPEELSKGANLRGSPEGLESELQDAEHLSIHDLNAKSHELKAEGRQIINDRSMDVEEEDKAYMGSDSTRDFFFAGSVVAKKKVVNERGRVETISQPARSYAVLPFSVDANPFVLSLWIYLSPMARDGDRRPRVILSTRTRDARGCRSDMFGSADRTTGVVLYAQPHYGDDGSSAYRIVLEYSSSERKTCQSVVGSHESTHLVREGEWHHVAAFSTRLPSEGGERISLYVNGDLAGRETRASPRLSTTTTSKTILGRYATNDGSEIEPGSDNFDLGGRVGLLSFWETGGRPSLSTLSNRMSVQTESDEEHVVRAINRAAFDVRAIKELSMQGLFVKAPSLLYAFDGQRSQQPHDFHLYSYSTKTVIESMASGRDGEIMSELNDGTHAHQRETFVPLGGNRYAEYKDGEYVPPKLTASERKELNEIARARSALVKKAMQHVWSGYEKYAYGKDELLPLSKLGQDNWGGMGTTLVDSLSTLWLMDMKDEFWRARDWVRDNLDWAKVEGSVSVFETTIRNLGGLLSAYDLSGDKVFLEKADSLGTRLMPAFGSRTGIPYGQVELESHKAKNTAWHSNYAVLSEIGTLQVEFRALARFTGKSEYAVDAIRALDELLKLDPDDGLYPTFVANTKQELTFGNSDVSLGAMGDSFYEYLLKVWLQGGKQEMKYRRLYDKSVKGITDRLIHMSRPSYLTYVAELKQGKVTHKMDHLACFLGGTLALGAYTHPDGLDSHEAQRQLKTGKQLAYTCYQMYARSKSGLSPEFVRFDTAKDDFVKGTAQYYILRPETAETFYILYHLTRDPVYREWSWEIFQAIEEHCKTDAGYAAIKNVDTMKQDDRMESFFLAETLKYLWLIHDDTNDIDLLREHVLNTEAHPLRADI